MLIHQKKFVVDNYAIDKTQVDYIFKSDKEYLYLNNALEYTWINMKSKINRYLWHIYDKVLCVLAVSLVIICITVNLGWFYVRG